MGLEGGLCNHLQGSIAWGFDSFLVAKFGSFWAKEGLLTCRSEEVSVVISVLDIR